MVRVVSKILIDVAMQRYVQIFFTKFHVAEIFSFLLDIFNMKWPKAQSKSGKVKSIISGNKRFYITWSRTDSPQSLTLIEKLQIKKLSR